MIQSHLLAFKYKKLNVFFRFCLRLEVKIFRNIVHCHAHQPDRLMSMGVGMGVFGGCCVGMGVFGGCCAGEAFFWLVRVVLCARGFLCVCAGFSCVASNSGFFFGCGGCFWLRTCFSIQTCNYLKAPKFPQLQS